MNLSLEDRFTDHVQSNNLNESVPRNFLIEPDKEKNLKKWLYWKSREDSGDNAKFLAKNPFSIEEIANRGLSELNKYISNNSDKTIVAILHGCLNTCMLSNIQKKISGITHLRMDNCGLYEFKKDGDLVWVETGYKSNNDLSNYVL